LTLAVAEFIPQHGTVQNLVRPGDEKPMVFKINKKLFFLFLFLFFMVCGFRFSYKKLKIA